MFITIPAVGLWTAHPFSLAWSEELAPVSAIMDPEKGLAPGSPDDIMIKSNIATTSASPSASTEILANGKTVMTAIIRRRDGFTHELFKKVSKAGDGRLVTRAFVEGPYGGQHTLSSYGTVILFAGGVGITHQVSYIRSLLAGYANGTVAVRRLSLVWVIQSPEHLEWIRPWMTQILGMERRREILRIQLFITKPRSTKEIQSPSATVQMFPGRPNVDALVGIEARDQVGAMAVSVCGPGALADEVRRAVRKRQSERSIDFIEEAFSW
jgi:NAD(P)H-flavin reductase